MVGGNLCAGKANSSVLSPSCVRNKYLQGSRGGVGDYFSRGSTGATIVRVHVMAVMSSLVVVVVVVFFFFFFLFLRHLQQIFPLGRGESCFWVWGLGGE